MRVRRYLVRFVYFLTLFKCFCFLMNKTATLFICDKVATTFNEGYQTSIAFLLLGYIYLVKLSYTFTSRQDVFAIVRPSRNKASVGSRTQLWNETSLHVFYKIICFL